MKFCIYSLIGLLLMISLSLETNAQDYKISFKGKNSAGDSITIDSVKVENLTQNTTLTLLALSYGDTLHLGTVGIEELFDNNNNIQVYPNPMQGQAEISFFVKQAGNAQLTIYDLSGRIILQSVNNFLQGIQKYHLIGLKQGMYFIYINGENYFYTAKLISQNPFQSEASIEYLGSERRDNGVIRMLKNTKSAFNMAFTTGNYLRFTGYYHNCYSIIEDIPIGDKTILFVFPNPIVPAITTISATSISDSTAILGGNLSSDGGCSITTRGVCWNTLSNPTIANNKTINGTGTGIFSSSLTNLTPATTYYVRAYAINSADTAYGNQITFTTLALPKLTTTAANLITNISAASGGIVTTEGGTTIIARGICWSTSPMPTIALSTKTIDNSSVGTGAFINSITGLMGNTTYYVRAYATNNDGTAYGNEIIFTTLAATEATLTTSMATALTYTTASSGGNITNNGGANITVRGVCWSTLTMPTISLSTKTIDGSGVGTFSSSLSGLLKNTTYYVRAYATNNIGTSYGNQISLTTLATTPALLTTNTATLITSNSALSGGNITNNGGEAISIRGVCWSTNLTPTIADSKAIDSIPTIGIFTNSITGLSGNTIYYARAYATNIIGTAYGNKISFTTLPTTPATLTTTVVSSITATTAKSGGNITSNGGASITARGVCWSKIVSPTIIDNKTSDSIGVGSFISSLAGLIPDSIYYVRAYATNVIGTAYGNQVNFKTMKLPILTTTVVSAITNISATSGGNISDSASATITTRGVCWSTLVNPTIVDNKTTNGSGIGGFSSSITGLMGNTKYYVKAYATTYAGTAYGDTVSFKTSPLTLPILTTTVAISLSDTSASTGGNITSNGGTLITARGVCWSKDTMPTISLNTKTSDSVGTGIFTSLITGLMSDSTYYVRAYATNSVGTNYGTQVSFKMSLPTLTTKIATSITRNTAISGGNIGNNGSASIIVHGVCWDTLSMPSISNHKTIDSSFILTGSFTSNLTGLTDSTKYYIRAYATNNVGIAYGDTISFKTLHAIKPTLTTTVASLITSNSAKSGGNITSNGGSLITARGVCWSKDTMPTISLITKTSDSVGAGIYTSLITGLMSDSTYYVRAYATNSIGTAYGNQINFKTLTIPTLTTTAASLITNNSATSGGNITSNGGTAIIVRGVCWSTSVMPTISDTKTIDSVAGIGTFTSLLTGLMGGTAYNARAYATNNIGTSYGNQIILTTLAATTATLTTTAASSITAITAKSGGNITSNGGSLITARGVCWNTLANPTIANNITSDSIGTGTFTSLITGLMSDSTYYMRAYATNSVGTAYGNQISFTTLKLPIITTTITSLITSNSSISGGNILNTGSTNVTARGVCWSTLVNPTIVDNKTINGSGVGIFTSSITGLMGNTTYYVRAYATSIAGTVYGNTDTFTTLPAIIASITTANAESFSDTSAISGGNIISDGGSLITARGVCWNTTINPTISNNKTLDSIGIGLFTSLLTGLSSNITYYIRAYAINSIGTAYGNEISLTMTLPNLTTILASSITNTTATTGGNILNDGSATITQRGVCWSTLVSPTTVDSKTSNGVGTGIYTSSMTGLTLATTYYVRAYATNNMGTAYGNQVSFTTLAATNPTITTTLASLITANTAICGGNITNDGGLIITTRGVCWDTLTNPTIIKAKTIDGSGTGTFTSSIIGLTQAKTYYVRAYAVTSLGTFYGNEIVFTSQNGVVNLSTANVSSITATSASTGGNITSDGGSPITMRGVCWNISANPTTAHNKTSNGLGAGIFTSSITGLTAITTYYVKAYAVNNIGTSYGNQVVFSTLPATIAILTTTTATSISDTSAISGGNITSDGGSPITMRGVCWDIMANPTIINNATNNGTGMGVFTSSITGLQLGKTYYVRAYANNSIGTAYGNQINFAALAIGKYYQGGIIFYIDTTAGGHHGLVCASDNQSTVATWGCLGSTIGSTSTTINSGNANTNAIVAGCNTIGIAAKLCYDLNLNTFSDWYLPSKDELNLMYLNLHTHNLGNFTDDYYWSSSEDVSNTANNALLQYFGSGYIDSSVKNASNYVRAIRAF